MLLLFSALDVIIILINIIFSVTTDVIIASVVFIVISIILIFHNILIIIIFSISSMNSTLASCTIITSTPPDGTGFIFCITPRAPKVSPKAAISTLFFGPPPRANSPPHMVLTHLLTYLL